MKSLPSTIYSKKYYLESSLGYEHSGKKDVVLTERTMKVLQHLSIKKNMKILDIGCGRGDIVLYMAQRGADVYGIDYSKAAIDLASDHLKMQKKVIQQRVHFKRMDAKNLQFTDNFFDAIISFDVFEHLYKEELEVAMGEIKRVLKPGGILLVHTEANKLYLDFTHRIWVYPMNVFLIWLNKLLTGKTYQGLSKDPRNDLHKLQHVNEPTHFYLLDLFKRWGFQGHIISDVSMVKKIISWKDLVYNIVVLLHPFSSYFPLKYFFTYDYICIMRSNK